MRLLLVLLGILFGAPLHAQTVGSSSVVTSVPAVPGYPETVIFRPSDSHAFVTSPGTPKPTAGLPASRVYEYNPSGHLVHTWLIAGENLLANHAVGGMAWDSLERLYVASTQLGILRLDLTTATQSTYSPLVADLPSCSVSAPPCSPTLTDTPPLENDMAFGLDGSLYVTDTNQATIWKVPAGGGAAAIWYQNPLFDGVAGPNGIRLDANGQKLYVGVSFPYTFQGVIYTLNIATQALAVFHTFAPGEGPDGFNFASSGNLYVPLPVVNAIAVLDPSGNELRRFTGPAGNVGGSPLFMPYDGPTSVSFVPGRPVFWFTNNATGTGNVLDMALISVYAGETGAPIFQP